MSRDNACQMVGNLSNLVKQHCPSAAGNFPSQIAANRRKSVVIQLRGTENEAELVLDRELTALASRTEHIEAKANAVNDQAFPITLDEQGLTPASPSNNRNRDSSLSIRSLQTSSRDWRSNWVTNW